MFELARGDRENGMTAYAELQEREFASEEHGYTATHHQREVGTGYFDEVAGIISGGDVSTKALSGSTEEAQFNWRRLVSRAARPARPRCSRSRE
jgi:isocitrate/methylisocitrate lyase